MNKKICKKKEDKKTKRKFTSEIKDGVELKENLKKNEIIKRKKKHAKNGQA